jgi:hypothetical protein
MGGCVPLVPTTSSLFFMMRSRAEPAEAPVATMRDNKQSAETNKNIFLIELLPSGSSFVSQPPRAEAKGGGELHDLVLMHSYFAFSHMLSGLKSFIA